MIACMGGWCRSRERCAHYVSDSKVISERLCGDNEEPEPVRHLLRGVQAPVSGEIDHQDAPGKQRAGFDRTERGWQEMARVESEEPEGL